MTKYASSFGKFLLFFFLLSPSGAFSAGVPFSIAGTAQQGETLEDPSTLTNLISQLKQQAVSEWLQGFLGERFTQFEKSINQDFSERYVLDYKVTRTGTKRDTLELTGHLDSDSLKKWVRLQDTRKGTTSLKPLVLFSSNLGNFSFSSSETSERLRDTSLGQSFQNLLAPLFQKINAKPTFADRSSPVSLPARFESDLGALRDYATQMGTNAALWIHLQTCATCTGGARVDLFFYSIPTQRIALAESEDLNLKAQDWGNSERVKAVLSPLFSQFQTGVEALISSGQLYTNSMRVIVEGIQNYKLYKALDSELSSSDFASQSFLKRAGSKSAEFEFLTPYSADEIAQRIQASEFAGLRVKAQKFDSRTIVVRYSK